MRYPKLLVLLSLSTFALLSCWDRRPIDYPRDKVWGYKPVYGQDTLAKKISFTPGARPVNNPGNIYAYQNFIFQMEPGWGIHVIDNSVPSAAKRIGFINVRGCSQISIKSGKLYTNSYEDLVVLQWDGTGQVSEISRLVDAFQEFRYGSPIATPPHSGYFECPHYDSLVIDWVQDSIYSFCYKN